MSVENGCDLFCWLEKLKITPPLVFRLLGSAIAWVSGLLKGLRERRFYSARSARCERTYQDCAIHGKTKLVFEYSGSSPNRHSRKRTSYLRPPSQNPVFLNSRTNSMFLHSCKRPVPATDTFFCVPRVSAYESFHCKRLVTLNFTLSFSVVY